MCSHTCELKEDLGFCMGFADLLEHVHRTIDKCLHGSRYIDMATVMAAKGVMNGLCKEEMDLPDAPVHCPARCSDPNQVKRRCGKSTYGYPKHGKANFGLPVQRNNAGELLPQTVREREHFGLPDDQEYCNCTKQNKQQEDHCCSVNDIPPDTVSSAEFLGETEINGNRRKRFGQ